MGEESRVGTVVLYPSPGMGHLVSMVELAKQLLRRHLLDVIVVVLEPPFNTGSTANFISTVSSSNPLISFHHLPQVDLSHFPTPKHHESLHFELIRLSNPSLEVYLSSIQKPRPMALVVDFFCTSSVDVAAKLGVPVYIFFTSSAACFATFLHLPTIHATTTESFKDLGDSPVDIPGILPIPASHMVLPTLDREDDAYKGFLEICNRKVEVDGMIINTFEWLEGRTIESIRATRAFNRPIYSVGPLTIADRGREGSDCLRWLDSQPKASVVFLCFGSLGRFSAEQLKQIAIGLENSQQRFLWVVRSPPSTDASKKYSAPPDPDIDLLLPNGFLDRTKDRGLVVNSWAPQVLILKHEAVGGFVTHLGWNSVLEAICAGVGMVGWPLYAEQWMNRVFVVDGMKLSTAMEGYDKEMVVAEEVERRVRELMTSEVGDAVRKRCLVAKRAAEEALGEGGTSTVALDELVGDWRRKSIGCGPEIKLG